MNSLNKILPIVAVVAAVGAAIIPAHKSGAQTSTTQYYWFDAATNTYQDYRTVDEEKDITECEDGGNNCARAFTSDQLNDPANPGAGHKNVPPVTSLKNQ